MMVELFDRNQKADQALRTAMRRVWDDIYQIYGVRKVRRQLKRERKDVERSEGSCAETGNNP